MLVRECSDCGRIKVCQVKLDYESRKLLRALKNNKTLFNCLGIEWTNDVCTACKKKKGLK